MICSTILDAVGNTPLVRLNRMPEPGSAQILVKMEALNVGGSIKTRTALNMIEQAEKAGLISNESIIVEPTSGNQGIGLALVGAVKGYRTVIVMPDSVSEERRKLVRHYGAEVRLIHDGGDIGKCIQECLDTALQMQREDPGSLSRSSSPTRTIPWPIKTTPLWRSSPRRRARSTDSAAGSEPAALLPASEKC